MKKIAALIATVAVLFGAGAALAAPASASNSSYQAAMSAYFGYGYPAAEGLQMGKTVCKILKATPSSQANSTIIQMGDVIVESGGGLFDYADAGFIIGSAAFHLCPSQKGKVNRFMQQYA